MYPEGTERLLSNWTARGSRIPGQEKVVFFGLQYFLRKYLMEGFEGFFACFDDANAREYQDFIDAFFGPNAVGSNHIQDLQDLGYLPLEFRALPEGTRTPLRVPMFTIENTHDDFFWLTNYLETIISTTMWLPCTSATTSQRYRQILDDAALLTGSPPEFVDWQGHDFSMRGMAGLEAAQLSGAGHLLYFTGSDTLPAVNLINHYYGKGLPEGYLVASSVPASEHSVVCAGGEEGERETVLRILDVVPTGIVSNVSDTWDYWGMLTEILPSVRDHIMERDGKYVVRPDSGDPVKIIVGDPNAVIGSPEYKGSIELLWETFGGTTTATGHKLLDGHIGLIYGDSITEQRCAAIVEGLHAKEFASGNVVFGIGSYTFNYVTRDTHGFAMKATWVQIDGEGKAIYKDPKTDDGLKKSAKGRLAVLLDERGEMALINEATLKQEAASLLRPVWRDGDFIYEENFAQIRERARSHP